MVKYPIGSRECRQCHKPSRVKVPIRKHNVEWICDNCGSVNPLFVDQVHVRVGAQFLAAAQDFIDSNDLDVAAVLLSTSVDASLSVGIAELMVWRAIEALQAPPDQKSIDCALRSLKSPKEKLKEFERLAGASLKTETNRLHAEGKIRTADLPAFAGLVGEMVRLNDQRNRLVHMGEPVDEGVISESIPAVRRAVFLLEAMYHAAFDLKRPALPRRRDLPNSVCSRRPPRGRRGKVKRQGAAARS
jgi:hypothetical protein